MRRAAYALACASVLCFAGAAAAKDPACPPYCGDFPGDDVTNHLWKQEVADATYRELGNVVSWYNSPRWPGHAAMYIGYFDGEEKVIQAAGDGSAELGSIQLGSFSGMHDHVGLVYWGAYRNPAVRNYADRRAILAQTWALHSDPDIGYTFLDCLDYNGWTWSGEIPDIDDVRCDGVTEYAIEKSGFDAWGKNGAHCDVTYSTDWCDEHNDAPTGLPPDYDTYNPNVNAYPCSQAGRAGPGIPNQSTWLRSTVAASPRVNATVYFSHAGEPEHGWYRGDVDIRVTARDVSGVHRIGLKWGGDRETSTDGWTNFFFANGNEEESVIVTIDRSTQLYYFAEDKAANYPRYGALTAVQIDRDRPTLVIQSPAVTPFTTSAPSVTISGVANDTGGSGLYRVEAYKGQYVQNYVFSGPTNHGSFSVTNFPLEIGTNTISLRAIDYAGWPSAQTSLVVVCKPVTLSVLSSPDNGATINVAPADILGRFGGNTGFTREYQGGEYVTLGAPASHGGRDFVRWERNGVAWSGSLMTSITVTGDCTMVAVYLADAYAAPAAPSGSAVGFVGFPSVYMTAGAEHPLHIGHGLQFEYDWGSGPSGVWGGAEQSHTWASPFAGNIWVRSRCASHTNIISPWSASFGVWIQNEAVTLPFPSMPAGPAACVQGVSCSYSGFATNNAGHAVQYQFDWDDGGPLSAWGAATQSHAWASAPPVYYAVKFRARCASHTNVISSWSALLAVTSVVPESVSTPLAPVGPHSVLIEAPQVYRAEGAASSLGHALEYEFDWGDGPSGFWGEAEQSSFWKEAGNYDVRVRARCAAHPTIVSAWSPATTVGVANVAIADPPAPYGETACVSWNTYQYVAQTMVTPTSGLETMKVGYEFDWGDGPSGVWGAAEQSHSWSTGSPVTKELRVRARVDVEGLSEPVVSGWSAALPVTVDPERISRPVRISGATNCYVGRKYTYRYAAESNAGHPLEYFYRWPGVVGSWGADTRTHVYSNLGSQVLYVRARCAVHSGTESADSVGLMVVVTSAPPWNPSDYNGDRKSDLPVFDGNGGLWYIQSLSGSVLTWANQWGWSGALPIAGDYDGDERADQALFDPAGGYWYIKRAGGGVITWANQWGWSTAKPVPGDYDNDGRCDLALFDTVGGYWYIKSVSGNVIAWKSQWGWSTARPVPGDYDGDHRSDLAVFDTAGGYWYIRKLAGGVIAWAEQWGWSTAKPVPGDYDGDGNWDLAVFDTAGGYWYIKSLTGGVIAWANQWGWSTARPVSGDYDGDGKHDLAVYDTATGYWYVKSLDGRVLAWQQKWGWPGATIPALEAAP